MRPLRTILFLLVLCALCSCSERKTVIGVSQGLSDYGDCPSIKESYYNSIYLAGAQPVIVPMTADRKELRRIVRRCDGIVLVGGCDVAPEYYGEEPHPMLGTLSAMRDSSDFALLDIAVKAGKPVLGICRGEQLVNVYFGGTLYQDIPSQHPDSTVVHSGPYMEKSHSVVFDSTTMIGQIFGVDTLEVNSCHHQAVKDLAPGLTSAAVSPDGLCEAYENVSANILAVQFHPEAFAQSADPSFLPLFTAFIQLCRK